MGKRKGIRTLYPEEIECRVGLVRASGLSVLLYKDARVDQKILDEAFGSMNWMRKHEVIGGCTYCTVSVRDSETGEWVSKQDVGSVAGNTEKEKSLASDSFKRACVNWGIGRELYTAPFIWISSKVVPVRQENGRYICNERFRVSGISYSSQNEIMSIVIENREGQKVFVWQAQELQDAETRNGRDSRGNKVENDGKAVRSTADVGDGRVKKKITQKEKARLADELDRTGVTMDMVDARFHVRDMSDMSPEVYKELMKALAATQTSRVA